MVGCGNSTLSAELHQEGYSVTSIDFSEVVIQEMQSRHPEMEWELMDMTQMSYPGGSFDAVVDKGSLDALMSEDSEAVSLKASAFFAEINRVLTDSGVYLLVSLGQEHILQALFDFFSEELFSLEVTLVHQLRANPLVPFVFAIHRRRGGPRLFFDCMGAELPEGRALAQSEAIDQVPPFPKALFVTHFLR